ncbi:hypothetical protein [Flavobacterium sp.]|uniref:hypothetical protein n=1 Tax=Flavobacterium sp. TaxID=239 RepID=UPI0039E53FFD
MNTIDPHNAIIAMEHALVPDPLLVDGRTEQDWLGFVADFASLIHFYDAHNTIKGNWAPFLLKDPVILLAWISKTNGAKMHALYLQTCMKLEQALASNGLTKHVANGFNQLFDQVLRLFASLERWIHYMQKSNFAYPLKDFIIYQITQVYGAVLWALVGLRKYLAQGQVIDGLVFRPENYEAYDSAIWLDSKDKAPFWEVLHLEHPSVAIGLDDVFNAVKTTADSVFVFFNTVVLEAKTAFENLQTQNSQFPDTVLMRTFLHLLMTHRETLNGISQKHLDFYYTGILRQQEKTACPDQVFITTNLANKNLPFLLPKGTLFDAGIDLQKNPIVFRSVENTNLNPAVLAAAHTLGIVDSGNSNAVYHQLMDMPSEIHKDENGAVLGWPGFGNADAGITPSTMGFSIASPLLLLREGQRSIVLTFRFDQGNPFVQIGDADYFLSTQSGWLPVPVKISPLVENGTVQSNAAVLAIDLSDAQPPIEKFSQSPDGYASDWPMFKIAFNQFAMEQQTSVLQSVAIEVTASGLDNLRLLNDFGPLDAKKPFPLFGPTPLTDSSFLIGSDEIFSKPLQSLHLAIEWEALPVDFQAYYQEYNNYIAYLIRKGEKPLPDPSGLPPKKVGILKKGWRAIFNFFKELTLEVLDFIGIKGKLPKVPFNNNCFTVGFEMFEQGKWNPVEFSKMKSVAFADHSIQTLPYTVPEHSDPKPTAPDKLLFGTDANGQLTGESYFSYELTDAALNPPKIMADATLQQQPFAYGSNRNGFVKMTLDGPPTLGFGTGLYPETVTYTVTQNALTISKDPDTNLSGLLKTPKLPFVPKVKQLSAHYHASKIHDLSQPSDYPLECFAQLPFGNHLIYRNAKTSEWRLNPGDTAGPTVSLFPDFNGYHGFLYLELTKLLPSSTLNFYVELARKYSHCATTDQSLDYFYLGDGGWEPLQVLSDGTNQWSCSGIVTVSVPANISNQTAIMPGKNHWICIATKADSGAFADITFLKTNGIALIRHSEYLTGGITANAIAKTHAPVPQLAGIQQPFASFGGRLTEEPQHKNKRVAQRIKTKDRALTPDDYPALIRQEFDNIFYCSVVYVPASNTSQVYVVKNYGSSTQANAFTPLVSECQEKKIRQYLQDRASAFTNISVSNFDFSYVTVNATVVLEDGYEIHGVQRAVQQALNLFLSPWIASDFTQVSIGQPITETETAAFLQTIAGVKAVSKLFFTVGDRIGYTDTDHPLQTVIPNHAGTLLVSGINHLINQVP